MYMRVFFTRISHDRYVYKPKVFMRYQITCSHIFKKIFIRLLDVFIQPFTCPKSVLTMEAASKQDTNMIHLYVLIHKESMVWKYRQNREYRHKVLYTVSVYTFNITMHYFIDFKCRSMVNYYRPAS